MTESLYKDIPKLNSDHLGIVSKEFGIADVQDFSPDGDTVGRSIPWPKISKAVLARDGYGCRICGKSSLTPVDQSTDFRKIHFELEVHHIVPRKDGGKDTFRNLISLCEDCHHKTFSNGYSGIPVARDYDLFSFEKRFYFALPPGYDIQGGEKVSSLILDGFDRVFDPDENRYRIAQVEHSRMKLNVASLNVDEYRNLVSSLLLSYDIKDYITLNAGSSKHPVKVRVLIDSGSDLLV